MEIQRAIVLCLLWILGVTYAQDFYVVAPSAMRINHDENVAIAYDGSQTVIANMKIEDYPAKKQIIVEKYVQLQSGRPMLFKVYLNATKFKPSFLSDSKLTKFVSLSVSIEKSKKEILIPISNQAGYMFIQSAKPIYSPKERAFFRITQLSEDGVPSTEKFKFQIKNPQGVVVDEKNFNERSRQEMYFADHSYKFPKYPILGEWKATVHYGNNLQVNSSISFDLKEYVLPTFTVKIETPDVILPDSKTISITVKAKYVYGKEVKGVVSMRLGVKREENSNVMYFAIYNPQMLHEGMHIARISSDYLSDNSKIGWFPRIDKYILVVEATVVDQATGNKMIETDSSTRFSTSPFIISFKRCLTDFKPGLPSVFEADITYVNGKPAASVPTKITAVADFNQPLKMKENRVISNEKGVVAFETHPENHHRTIRLKLETYDSKYGENQAKGTFIQNAYQTKNSAYVAIARMSASRLEPGDLFARDVYLEPKGIQDIYCLVVARGKILSMDKLYEGEYKVHRMEFRITYDMVPSFRVVVFAHYRNDLIADSLRIEVGKICNPKAEVTLEPKFDLKQPGSNGKIVMKGTKGTAVGLLGVDDAVYALSKKDILTRENMFEKLESHDLGCGPGGGIDTNSVLGNAGITIGTNKFTPSPDHSCVVIKRRKRSAVIDLLNEYEGKNRTCCGLGLLHDPHKRDCRLKSEGVDSKVEDIMPNCSEIMYECCMRGQEMNLTGWVFPGKGKGGGDGTDDFEIIDPELEDELERETTVRKDFREILINTVHLIGYDGKAEVEMSLPHSITTWVIQAVSVNPTHGICVAEPKELVSFKNIFLHVNIPYSIKLLEQVEVEATVFNYGGEKMLASVFMYGVDGLCSGTESGRKSERKKLYVDKKSAATVTFSVVPLRAEDFVVKFFVSSIHGTDAVEKTLHVVSPGIREERDVRIKLDPTNRQRRERRNVEEEYFSDQIDHTQNLQVTALKVSLPDNTVPGTAICSITASGDLIGPSVETCLNNPEDLIKKPRGCGEQNLVNFAPTIYTMRYLLATGRLSGEKKEKGMEFIRKGYDNQLWYKKSDGSYSAWFLKRASTWLTAFVMKVFCQASEFYPIDKHVIDSGLDWLVRNQHADGSFTEKHRVYHRTMMGGVDGTIAMTAFALIALAECDSDDENVHIAKQRAVAYLDDHILESTCPLPAAVVAYALTLCDSEKKQLANDRLLSMAKRDQVNNYLYWTTKNSAEDIETAGYALLTQLIYDDISKCSSIVNWLNTKQLKSGRYKSTQDTVIALQALSEYAIRAKDPTVNLVSNITLSRNASFHEIFIFNKDNALDVKEITLEDPDGTIFVTTAGYGMGTLTATLRYNVIKPEKEICKFDIEITHNEIQLVNHIVRDVERDLESQPDRKRREASNNVPCIPEDKEIKIRHKREDRDTKKDYALKLKICVKYLGSMDAEMSIVDVGIFSGFEPTVDQLDKLVNDPKHLIEKYEKSNRGVVFYLEKVPVDYFYCFAFDVVREYVVGNIQSSTVKVYDYYNPDATCTKYYSPDKRSSLLSTICEGGVCQCAEGGCAPKDPFAKFSGYEVAQYRREDIKKMFCDDFDYVWKGSLGGRMQKNGGLLNITFLVDEVIKAGIEPKEDVEKKTRTILAKLHCDTTQFLHGATYLVLGKDPPARKKNDNIYYLYKIDRNSIVYHLALDDDKGNEQLMHDLEMVMEELKMDKGCDL